MKHARLRIRTLRTTIAALSAVAALAALPGLAAAEDRHDTSAERADAARAVELTLEEGRRVEPEKLSDKEAELFERAVRTLEDARAVLGPDGKPTEEDVTRLRDEVALQLEAADTIETWHLQNFFEFEREAYSLLTNLARAMAEAASNSTDNIK